MPEIAQEKLRAKIKNFRLANSIEKRLEAQAARLGVSKADAVRLMIARGLESHEREQRE